MRLVDVVVRRCRGVFLEAARGWVHRRVQFMARWRQWTSPATLGCNSASCMYRNHMRDVCMRGLQHPNKAQVDSMTRAGGSGHGHGLPWAYVCYMY